MTSSYVNPNTGEKTCYSYNHFGTTEGEIRFGDVMTNGTKMAVMIRRIFPNTSLNGHYIGLIQSGKLDGSILNVAPATYQVVCGEKPVDNIAGYFRAENGDLILHAPNGRVRIIAKDIDLYASGNGTDTGWINLNANATIDVEAPTVQLQAQDSLAIGSERNVNLNVPGEYKVSCGNFKVVETPDVSPITSQLGSGSNTILQTLQGIEKLIRSLQ